MSLKLTNNAVGFLASGITAPSTTINLQSGNGAKFPALSGGDYFPVTLVDSSGNIEIAKCTARSGDVLTVTRAQEGTVAQSFAAGSRCEIRLTASTFLDQTSNAQTAAENAQTTADSAYQRTGRNKIINGGMDVSQRGTSFAAIANLAYSLDRWQYAQSSSAVVTASQQADAPSDNEFQNSLRITVTTADTSIASTDFCLVQQIIEGYNVRDLIGKTFTLSFWVRSSKTGIHCVGLNNSVDRTYSAEYTVGAANTWEHKTITITNGLITAGTWNWVNGAGLTVRWALAAGTDYHQSPGSWASSARFATSNQVNCLDTIGNIFAITGVQLELGSVSTGFEHRHIGHELALCQRYYETGTLLAVGDGTMTYVTSSSAFNVAKRATPTVQVLDNAGNNNACSIDATNNVAAVCGSPNAFSVFCRVNNTLAGLNSFITFNYRASAEL